MDNVEQNSINSFLYKLYENAKTASISLQARKKYHNYDQNSFVYGDSHLPSLYEIFNKVSPKPGEVFYDLGSGGGRVVLFAALSHPFTKCVGVELLDDLVTLAEGQLKLMREKLPELVGYEANKLAEIKLIQGDIATADIRDADVIYAAATCFEDKLMKNLTKSLEEQLANGTRVITFTKTLPSKKFEVFHQQLYPMEWGEVTVYFHKKI